MSFWRFLLGVIIVPIFGAFLASMVTWAWGTSFQSNYGALAWSVYAGFIGIFAVIVWKKAKPRETWDKTVSPSRQQLATDWYIRRIEEQEKEK